jgi:predicted lipoprotein
MALVACCAMTSCVPWVVRPIEKEGAQRFDAVRYVDTIWQSQVVAEPSLKRGEGCVTRVEDGRLMLDSGITVLTGPVIRGTALRDALPFIQFSQFTNQLEYARVANALNDRAVKVAQTSQVKAGDTVRYVGAPSTDGVVPVFLERH